MKNLLLIINNKTRTQNERNTFKLVNYFAKYDYKSTVYPIAEGLTLDLDEYITDKHYDLVVCLGGDGTLNRTINSILKNHLDCPIGYIPAGTTNDFAKNLELTDDVDYASSIITHGKPLSYDIGKFNDRFFNYVACFGAFSDVPYATDQSFKNLFGYAAYALQAISTIPENLSTKCHLKFETETESFEGDYIFGAICNSLSVAGVKINTLTEDNLHDGVFELFLIKCPTNAVEIGEILMSIINMDFNTPYCQMIRTSKLKITSSENVYWTLDGEEGGNPNEIDFSILPGAVKILVKK